MLTTSHKYRASLVDDHPVFLMGFQTLLSKFSAVEVIGSYQNGPDLLNDLEKNTPDLIFMDVDMPGMNGIEATRNVLSKFPSIKVVAVTMHNDGYTAERMFQAGACGYASKMFSMQEMENILACMERNEKYIMPDVAMSYARYSLNDQQTSPPAFADEEGNYTNFTKRQLQIIKDIAKGKTDKEIAVAIGCSRKTIEADKKRICIKLQVKKAAEIVSKAYEMKMLS